MDPFRRYGTQPGRSAACLIHAANCASSRLVLVDIEVAHFLLLRLAGRNRMQRRAAEECDLDVLREAMEAEEPALALDAVERRVPLDRLSHAGHGAHDERIEPAPDVAFPAGHGRDVGLHRGVAVGLRDLRVAASEERRPRGLAGRRLRRHLARSARVRSNAPGDCLLCDRRGRLLRRLAWHRVYSSVYDRGPGRASRRASRPAHSRMSPARSVIPRAS